MVTQVINNTETSGALSDTDLMIWFRPGQNDEIMKQFSTMREYFAGVYGATDQTGDYTILDTDRAKVITLTGSTAATFTLPDITGNVAAGWDVWVANDSTADLTVTGNRYGYRRWWI